MASGQWLMANLWVRRIPRLLRCVVSTVPKMRVTRNITCPFVLSRVCLALSMLVHCVLSSTLGSRRRFSLGEHEVVRRYWWVNEILCQSYFVRVPVDYVDLFLLLSEVDLVCQWRRLISRVSFLLTATSSALGRFLSRCVVPYFFCVECR